MGKNKSKMDFSLILSLCVCSRIGLGGIAILVLDISDRKKTAILLFIAVFTKTCELTVLLESFDLFTDLALQVPGFCLH